MQPASCSRKQLGVSAAQLAQVLLNPTASLPPSSSTSLRRWRCRPVCGAEATVKVTGPEVTIHLILVLGSEDNSRHPLVPSVQTAWKNPGARPGR